MRLISRSLSGALALAAGLSACGSPTETATTAPIQLAALAAPTPAAPASPATVGPTLTLSFDGVREAVVDAPLSLAPKGGFVLGLETAKAYVTIMSNARAPLAVGTYAIRDTVGSAVSATASLPARFAQEEAAMKAGYITKLGYKAGHPLAFIYDWGKGIQELHGRQLGQIAFTRVADATADGSFQFTVYGIAESHPMEYQGSTRVFQRLKGHEVQGTFKNVPYGNPQKAIDDLQKALKTLPH